MTCWSRQRDLLRACATYDRVACRSGHKVSKSTSAAALGLWWAMTRPGGRSIIIAPGDTQIREIIWRELTRFQRTSRVPLGGDLAIDPRTGWRFPRTGGQIIGISTDQPIRLAGFSGANLLFIVDEAPGVADEMFEPILGNLAGGAKVALFGNPVFASGQFHRAFVRERHLWHTMHISSEESPNITGEMNIPGLATAEWVREMEDRWGRDSNWFRVRVLGEFPEASDDALIPLAWVDLAVQRWRDLESSGRLPEPTMLSLDVAGGTGRDAGVIAAVHDLTVVRLWQSNQADTMEQTGRMYQGHRRGCKLVVDADGLGAPVVHRLRELGATVTAYQGGVGTDESDESGELRFANRRSASWWRARDILDPAHGYEPALPPDDLLVEDLLAIRYKTTSAGRIQIESKDAIRRRLGGRSPDRGDAVVMAWSEVGRRYAPLPPVSPVW